MTDTPKPHKCGMCGNNPYMRSTIHCPNDKPKEQDA